MRKVCFVLATLFVSLAAGCATTPAPAVEIVSPSAINISALAGASAAPTAAACKDEFLLERPPVLINRPAAPDLDELCFEHFAVLHSASKRGPLWSAYVLTKKMSKDGDAFTGSRPDYHEEAQLPEGRRSREADFAGNPYDVGHMTPNNDMPDKGSQRDSFSMANMSPQLDSLNRGPWKSLEASIHKLAQKSGSLYIVTGPIYSENPKLMNGRVAIPIAFFKAVYDQSTGRAIAFVFDNSKDAKCKRLTLAQLESAARIKPFPTLSTIATTQPGDWDVTVCNMDRGPR